MAKITQLPTASLVYFVTNYVKDLTMTGEETRNARRNFLRAKNKLQAEININIEANKCNDVNSI